MFGISQHQKELCLGYAVPMKLSLEREKTEESDCAILDLAKRKFEIRILSRVLQLEWQRRLFQNICIRHRRFYSIARQQPLPRESCKATSVRKCICWTWIKKRKKINGHIIWRDLKFKIAIWMRQKQKINYKNSEFIEHAMQSGRSVEFSCAPIHLTVWCASRLPFSAKPRTFDFHRMYRLMCFATDQQRPSLAQK